MKKLLTLVLALVLVFAIAAPALAITGDIVGEDPDPTKVDFVTVDLQLFKSPYSDEFGFQLAPIAANQAYIVDQMLFYGVKVSFVGVDEDEETRNMAASDYLNAQLVVTATGVTLADADDAFAVDEDGVKSVEVAPDLTADDELIKTFNASWFGTTSNTYYLFGTGIVTGKGIVKAELVKENTVDAGLVIYEGTTPLYRVTFNDTDDRYDVEVLKSTDVNTTLYWVGFEVNADNEVEAIYAAKHGEVYRKVGYNVPGIPTSVIIPKALNGIDITDDTTGKDAKVFAAFEKVMAFFGFNYNAEGMLQDKHFEAKASGLYLKDEVAIQLYTGSIVIPGDVVPPKTGDAASIVGFVMIAVAMIAAGVVVSRKVRA